MPVAHSAAMHSEAHDDFRGEAGQLGADLDGASDETLGKGGVALSGDGLTLVVGAAAHLKPRAYSFDGAKWQLGPDVGVAADRVAGVALKCFRDGAPSANLVATWGFPPVTGLQVTLRGAGAATCDL